MTRTLLLTTAVVFGVAGAATAQCSGDYASSSEKNMTPIPMADAEPATELPAILLPLSSTEVTDEG